ncbi:MAG TPA: hypothetical protein VFX12_02460 [Vicinamibacterales bacterium]|nr:hypothetical protein [Vicinamibacterales bacterium]
MFSVVRAVLLWPLPYPDPGRLVRVDALDSRHGAQTLGNLSLPDADDLQRAATSLSALGVYNAGYFTVTGAGSRSARRAPTSCA